MDVLVVFFAMFGLMIAAYRGYSVIVAAPLIAIFVLVVTDFSVAVPAFNEIFMVKLASFIKLYFPIFLLGAIFGKLFEVTGASRSVAFKVVEAVGLSRSIFALVLMCALLTYAGVSLFVVVFTVYPFAAELFKINNVPKRLIPASIALGAFSFTMDALPGTPQILNVIPTTFFDTTAWAAPKLGVVTSCYILIIGLIFLNICRKNAVKRGEGYGFDHVNESVELNDCNLPGAWVSIIPLLTVGILNYLITVYIPVWYGPELNILLPGMNESFHVKVSTFTSLWAIQVALFAGVCTLLLLFLTKIIKGSVVTFNSAVGGAVFAVISSASEFGFGAIISVSPGFLALSEKMRSISDPLVNVAVSINILSGITASASGGLSLALGAMADSFISAAVNADIPMEVLHRVASLAAGGMDTLPHNGAVITLLAVTGLTHRQSYPYIFGITLIKVSSSFFAIFIYYIFGFV